MNDAESASAADLTSHLATGNWQSFELRMRRRRADRCLALAQQALRERRPQDARAALEEAVRLVPDLSGADAVARQLAEPRAHGRSIGRWIAAAAVMVAAGFAFTLRSDWRSAFEIQTRTSESAANTRAGALAPRTQASAPASVRIETERVTPKVWPPATAPVEPVPPPERRVLEASVGAEAPPSTTMPAPPSSTPAPAQPQPDLPAVATASAARAEPPLPEPSKDVTFVARAKPSNAPPEPPIAAAAPPEPEPDPAPVTATPSAPSRPEVPRDEDAIRDVLSRYALAYSTLDASAARDVWPAVDEHALARAFDSLSSQQVSLSSCDIALVAADAAHANCSGTTTWEPKVGRGPQSQAHRWSFQLARNGTQWAIVEASVK